MIMSRRSKFLRRKLNKSVAQSAQKLFPKMLHVRPFQSNFLLTILLSSAWKYEIIIITLWVFSKALRVINSGWEDYSFLYYQKAVLW